MMSTRDETRRELKDLAKLAADMPKERPTVPPPASAHAGSAVSPSRITLPPAVSSVPAPPPLPLRARVGSASSSPPAFRSASLGPPVLIPAAQAKGAAWLGLRAVAAGATLIGAMVGGLLLGQALASHPATASVAHPATTAIAGVPQITALPLSTATATAAATPVVAPNPTEAASEAPATLVIADTSAPTPTVMVRAPRPVHHAEPRPAPKPLVASAPPAPSVPAAKPSFGAKGTPSRLPAHDSLDDLIRKAAASN